MILTSLVASASLLAAIPPFNYRDAAEQLTAAVDAAYWSPDRNVYLEDVKEDGSKGKDPAFAWDMAVELSALAAASKVDAKKYKPLYDRAFASIQPYGAVYNGVFGYGVWPNGSPPDRYYDDDEWIGLAQMDAYDAMKADNYLADAKKTFDFVLSGLSTDLGGGVFWREKERTSKNTCSNAPAMALAARIYLASHDKRYLDTAVQIHDWVEQLKDTDNLMFDNINLAGKVEKTKWTYNTALMIRGDLSLYKATGDRKYLDEAVAMGKASVEHWVDPSTGAIRDEASFAHHLSEAFLALSLVDRSKPWLELALNATRVAYGFKGPNGMFGSRWDQYRANKQSQNLLGQASMERALWMAASYWKH